MKTIISLLSERENKICSIVAAVAVLVLLCATAAGGADIDESLPPNTPAAVKTSVERAIDSGLEEDAVVELTRAMLQNGFEPQQIQRAHALMAEANISHMPVMPLTSKAFEGMAKNVDPALILAAMEAVHSRNAFAFQIAARLSDNKEQTAMLGQSLSAGLAAGLEKDDADKIAKMIEHRSSAIKSDSAYSLALECFDTARDVSRLGVSSQAVTDMVAGALSKGFSGQDMRAMRGNYLAEARLSNPQELANRYAISIQAGKGVPAGSGGRAGDGKGSGEAGHDGSGPGGTGGGSGSGGGGSGGSGAGGPGSGGTR